MASERPLRVVIAGLAVAGAAAATYLSIVHLAGEVPICAAGGKGCSTVTTSEYAELGPIPVPMLGVAGYLLLLASAALASDLGRIGGMFLALVGFGFSTYLTYLELFVIDAICQWCVVSALLITLLLAATAARAIRFAGTGAGSARG